MKNMMILLPWLAAVACTGEKNPGKSPYFEDNDILTVSGQFLDQDSQGLPSTSIALRNLRIFAYINPSQTYFAETMNWFLALAFPMFPGYDTRPVKVKPNYFLKEAVTARDGSFTFQMRADQTLRDAEGGINITLINDGDGTSASYAKYNFVIKAQETQLEPIALCDLGETVQENAQTLDWSWSQPSYALDHYEIRIADAQDNSLLWASRVEGSATQLSLPKGIFQASTLRYAIEVFYRFEDEFHTSCLTPSRTLVISSPFTNRALQKKAQGENIPFTITSLTNGRFNDVNYFAAYDTRSVTIDLEDDTLISSINLHNLQFSSSDTQTLIIEAAMQDDPDNFLSIGLDAATPLRFGTYTLPTPGSYAKVRISTSQVISSLQEVSIQ
ncbi:hypothetical protein [Oligoflexus tunisiensis]|uniref:hypothetical protein n=1 Tax=Oligoflexus tunisiensis TaxID=708132 RepID=UPI00114CB33A|nr:hypothetical protein [Oligoflexus tunisiensis]